MNKKICSILTIITLSLSFVGCTKGQPKQPTKAVETTKAEQKQKETTVKTETQEEKAERIAREWAKIFFSVDPKLITQETWEKEINMYTEEIQENFKTAGYNSWKDIKKEIENKKVIEKFEKIENMETKKIQDVIEVNMLVSSTKDDKQIKTNATIQINKEGKIAFYEQKEV